MLPVNVQTIQDTAPSDLVRQTLRTITAEFLSRLSGTPTHRTEAALGSQRKTLPELTLMEFLWSGDGSYFPAFCSLYLLDEQTRSEHERHIHSFLEFARDLYAERGGGPYRLRDICTELGHGGRAPIQPISLIVGAHFSRSFGTYYHSFQGSPAVDLTHVEPGTAIEVPEIRFHLTPNILDYKDLDTSWEEQIKPRLVRARTASVAGPAESDKESQNGRDQSWDVFISHASEDRGYCEPLAEALEKVGIRVWLDKTTLKWGDDLRSEIDRGLRNCRYGIVIFSKAFLKKKKWTEYELSSLFALEKVGEKRILPIWHGVTHEDLLEYSAGLADRLAKVSSSDSYQDIVDSLCTMLGRSAPGAAPEADTPSAGNRLEERERIQASAERTGRAALAQNGADTEKGSRRSAAPTLRSTRRGMRRQPVKATILNMLIASPSDVSAERDAVESAIQEWNGNHHERMGIMLQPVRWETHSYPASGDRPQAILNKQIVESGDILIGIFGYKLGTPTGKAQSGTIEEIEEFRKAGKYVALYFSKADVPRTADLEQLKALADYQRERQKDTLYGTFQSTEELRRLVTQHLPKIVAEVSGSIEDLRPGTPSPRAPGSYGPRVAFSEPKDDLSPKEIEVLWNAAKAPPGEILHNETLDGESIRVNGRQFLEGVDARTGAEWVAAFRRLQERGYLEPLSYDSDFFRVTSDGYQAADALEGFARWDARYVVLRAPYIGYKLSDEFRLSCTGVIALPASYFDDQIGADGTIQRSVKEPPSLIVEGIDSNPALTWTPTEIEFFDNASKMVKIFGFEGMHFLRPRSLKLLAAHSVEGATPLGDYALDELANHGLLPGTEAFRLVAEPDSDSKPDGFLVGSRNAWVRFLEQCWPIIGSQILSVAQAPASTIDDVRRAFLPAKEHPHDSGLGTHFYRERIQKATPADVVATGMHFDKLDAEILQATADKRQVESSCRDVEAALRLATDEDERDQVRAEAQHRKERLEQLDVKLTELLRAKATLEETLRDQQAYVSRSETLDFLHAAEQPVDPRHIANAVAALPRKSWRESVAFCSRIPFDPYMQHEYQVFLAISSILCEHSADLDHKPIEVFRKQLLLLPPETPGRRFLGQNLSDLRLAIEEATKLGPLNPFSLTRMFLARAMRQKDPLEKLRAERERLWE